MPDLGNTSVFSQTDGSNNSGTMPSWSGSAAPSTLDDAGRAIQGAVTREWNWRNVTLTTGGTTTAYTLTYSVAPAAYYNGQRFAFIVNAANTAAATLNVNSLGAKNLRKMVNGTATALAAGDLASGAYCEVAYNTSGDYFVILNRDLSMLVPEANANGFLRNRIINGGMQVDKWNDGSAVTLGVSSIYGADRWQSNEDTDGGMTVQQSTTTPPTGFTHSMLFTTTVADASLAAGQYVTTQQKIEGLNVSDLGWGAAGAQAVTISFWVRSSLTGSHSGALQNSAQDRSYPFSYTISSANTWEQKTVTIPGDTTGTWLKDTGTGIRLIFDLGSGTSLRGTAGAWAASGLYGVTGAVSVISTLSATWQITGVQLEAGTVATPFERRPFGQELSLCQRYYFKTKPAASGEILGVGFCNATTSAVINTQFPVEMRTRPTALLTSGTATDYGVFYQNTTANLNAVPSFGAATLTSARSTFSVASGLTLGQGAMGWTNNSSAYLAWSAEL